MKFVSLVRQRLRRRLVQALIVLTLVAVPAALWLNHWSNAPAETTIHIAQPALASATKPTYKLLSTAYFTTEIPSSWQTKTTTSASGRLQIIAFAPSEQIGQVGFTSALLPSDGLSGVADYKLRIGDPATYKRVSEAAMPAGSETFTTNDASEYTTFLVRGGRYAAVSVTGLGSADAQHTFLLHILSAWLWKIQ